MAADVFTINVVGFGEFESTAEAPGAKVLAMDLVLLLKRAGFVVRSAKIVQGNPEMRAFEHDITAATLEVPRPEAEVKEVGAVGAGPETKPEVA